MITTDDINSWKRVVRELGPVFAPVVTGGVAILLDPQSWATAISGAATGTVSALIAWSNAPPKSNGGAPPAQALGPPPSVSGPPTSDIVKRTMLGVLVTILTILLVNVAHAATLTSSTAKTSSAAKAPAAATLEAPAIGGLAALLGLNCDRGFCLEAPLTVTAVGLDGELHALRFGPAIGLDYKRPFKSIPIEAIGVSIAPLLELDHVTQQLAFAAVAHVDVWHGLGGGIAWNAFAIGGPDPGLHPFHRSHLALVFTVDALNPVPQ